MTKQHSTDSANQSTFKLAKDALRRADVHAYYYGYDDKMAAAFGDTTSATGYAYQSFDSIESAYSQLTQRDIQALNRQGKRGAKCKAAALFHFSDHWADELDALLRLGMFTQFKCCELVWIAFLQFMDAGNTRCASFVATEAVSQSKHARRQANDLGEQLIDSSDPKQLAWRRMWKDAQAVVARERLELVLPVKCQQSPVKKMKV